MAERDDTQAVADAHETRDLVLTAGLVLAHRVIEHVDEHEVAYAIMEEDLPGGGFVWKLKAAYGHGHTFVSVKGRPTHGEGVQVFANVAELAAVMGNEQASFVSNVPRAWVEAAFAQAARTPGFASGEVEPLP